MKNSIKSLLVLTAVTLTFGNLRSNAQVMVKDIYPGAGSSINSIYSYPNLTNVSGILYFVAIDDKNKFSLWKSDGTATGTVMVKNYPLSKNSSLDHFTNVNGILYFIADDGTNGIELWKSDGTAAGTVMVKDIYPLSNGSSPDNLTNVNGTVYFSANNGINGIALWKSDGTATGTVMVKDGLSPSSLININGILYCSADALWKSDGTAGGTIMLKYGLRDVGHLTNVNGILYFSANDAVNGTQGIELWKSDGTAAGTVLVKDIFPGITSGNVNSSAPDYLTDINGTLYFSANDGTAGVELWKSDGTAAGTVMVKDIYPGYGSSFSAWKHYLTNINGTLYFLANDGIHEIELWKSDGTAAGTVMVKDISSLNGSSLDYLINVNGTLYFRGFLGGYLWKSDGTDTGTVVVKDSLFIDNLTHVNGTVYFTADDGTHGEELWKYDTATGISKVGTTATNIVIYPNPAKDKISIAVGSGEKVSIIVYDVIGNVLSDTKQNRKGDTYLIDLSAQQAGVYFIKVQSEKGSEVKKVVVVK